MVVFINTAEGWAWSALRRTCVPQLRHLGRPFSNTIIHCNTWQLYRYMIFCATLLLLSVFSCMKDIPQLCCADSFLITSDDICCRAVFVNPNWTMMTNGGGRHDTFARNRDFYRSSTLACSVRPPCRILRVSHVLLITQTLMSILMTRFVIRCVQMTRLKHEQWIELAESYGKWILFSTNTVAIISIFDKCVLPYILIFLLY